MHKSNSPPRKNVLNIRLARPVDLSDRDRGEVVDYISQQFGYDIGFISRRPGTLGVTLLSQENINRVVNSYGPLQQLSTAQLIDELMALLPKSHSEVVEAEIIGLDLFGVSNNKRSHIALRIKAPQVSEECKMVRRLFLQKAGEVPIDKTINLHVSFGHSNIGKRRLLANRRDLGRLGLTTLNLMPAQIKSNV